MSHPALRHLTPEGHLGIAGRINHDIVANPVREAAPPGSRHLRYHGGMTMATPVLYHVFLDDWWDDWQRLEQFGRDLMEQGYLEPLRELGYGYRTGVFGGSFQLRPGLPANVRDRDLRAVLASNLVSGALHYDPNVIYALMLPGGTSVQFDDEGPNGGGCKTWCGYHSHLNLPDGRLVIYSVEPSTQCGPCRGGHGAFEAFTMVLAHEVAEAITDPTAQGWWCDDDGSENADIVAWEPFAYGPWTVQGYYCNQTGNTMGAFGSVVRDPEPQPEPQPQPEPVQSCRDNALAAVDRVANALNPRAHAQRAVVRKVRKELERL